LVRPLKDRLTCPIEFFSHTQVDLIGTDFKMPFIDGARLASAVRSTRLAAAGALDSVLAGRLSLGKDAPLAKGG
jgi:hypothetical protein